MKQKVKAKITRTVTEVVICMLDHDGNVEEILDICDELEYEVNELHSIQTVISEY
jgi:hypothetical protein